MSIGTQFLARLQEAKAPKKGYEFDRGVESMKRAMRKIGGESDFADKIAEVLGMVGIPGMYLNKAEVRESVIDAAQTLRSKPARVRSFLALHSALKNFHGVTPMTEAKGEEADLEGNSFQQLVEEVLVSLGAPQEMVTAAAKAAVKSGMRRTIAKLRADDQVRAAFIAYARYSGIKLNDGDVGIKKKLGAKVTEAVARGTVGTDDEGEAQQDPNSVKDLNAAAMSIMAAMGVDMTDEKIVRIVNPSALARSIRATARNANVKQSMAAFLRVLK